MMNRSMHAHAIPTPAVPISDRRIVLASSSPRRKFLLESACFNVEVISPDADETWPDGPPEQAVMQIATRKLQAVRSTTDKAILAADTVVLLDDKTPLGKPRDSEDAKRMLAQLSGREHRVITGFVVSQGRQRITESVVSHVWFRPLCAEEIEHYVASGEPLDKAGSYGIQGPGGSLIEKISGSYSNIVGLPVVEVIRAWEALQ